MIHQHGPHIFHTNSRDGFNDLSRFTERRPDERRILAAVGDKLVSMPINRTTLNLMYEQHFATEDDGQDALEQEAAE